MATQSILEPGDGPWETITEGVRRKIIPSDKRILVRPEEPAEVRRRFLVEQINGLPNEEYARYILTLRGSKGLHRAGALAQARQHILDYPGFAEGDFALNWALDKDNTELLVKLKAGKDYENKDYRKGSAFDANTIFSYNTALYYTISRNRIHNAILLLEEGADPNVYSLYENSNDDDPWQTPLHCAASHWRLDSVKLLLDRGADVNALSLLKGQTALHHALLAARFSAKSYDWTALQAIVECLTSAGVDVNIRDDEKESPLDVWIQIAHRYDVAEMRDITAMLLKAGADINAVGRDGCSSFMLAAAIDGPSNLFRFLLQNGNPTLDLQDESGDTALHMLSVRGVPEDVSLLMEAGADPNIQNLKGETPLHRAACQRGYEEIVASLLTRADPKIQQKDGRTAIELALMAGGISETMQIFRNNGQSLATIVLNWDKFLNAAHQSGTVGCQFDALVLGPEAGASFQGLYTHGLGTVLSSPRLLDPGADPMRTTEMINSHNAAFSRSVHKLKSLQTLSESNGPEVIVPKRLIDVTEGKFVNGDASMKYVIGSYLWSPDKTPDLPEDSDCYESIPETSERVLEACTKYPDFIEMVLPEHEGIEKLQYPSKDMFPKEPSSEYLTEVYRILGREALRRGLRYIWIDSFCITQDDEKDKAEQIPLMSDYYTNADCCVIISESLRRRVRPEFDPSRTCFDSQDSVTDRILGWAIGFHFNRVWVLQESRLAKEVITRSGNVRIKTSEALAQNFNKDSADANKLWRHTFDEWDPANRTQASINKANQKLPLSGSRIDGGHTFSTDFCMMLLRDRDSLYRHDRILGALGLFPAAVRISMPIDYTLSLSAVFAIFIYLRIQTGDLIGLLSVRAPDQPPHYIQDGPSYIPSGYGYNYSDVLDLQTDPVLNFRTGKGGSLHLQMAFIRIADCFRLDHPMAGSGSDSRYGNVLVRLMNADGMVDPSLHYAAVEPVDPNYSLTSNKHFGTSAITVMGPAVLPTTLSASEARNIAEERERRRIQIQIAARQDSAVIAMLGIDRRTATLPNFPVSSVWLILCTPDNGRTWRKHGLLVMMRALAECFVSSGISEAQEFCIV